MGSNAWAIAPSRSERGHAMLLANPHLPWSDLFTFFEAQLTAPGINAYGAALVGMPVLAIAFKCTVVGERLSPYVAAALVFMGLQLLMT